MTDTTAEASARPTPAEGRQEHDLRLDGGRSLFAVEAGAGPPVVLVHGMLATRHDMLLGPFDPLAKAHRVVAIDRPGHGSSRRERFEAAPRRQAELIRAGLLRLGVERPVLVGHSFGGMVSLAYAAAFPQDVAGLVLLAPLGFPEFRPAEHLFLAPRALPLSGPLLSQAARPTIDPALLRTIQRTMFAPQDIPPHWDAAFPHDLVLRPAEMVANGEDAATLLTPASLIDLAAIRAPVHVVTGTSDRIVNPSLHALPLARRLPDARLTRLDGLGHMAHHFAPDAVMTAVEDVLARSRQA